MKKKNAFTLVEMLSVIVILGITFMFVIPSLTELFTMGNKTETELIEERVLSAAKEYVNKIDGSFYTKLYKEGDTNFVYKSDLINAGLITEEEVSKLNTFAGVKGEVIKNDRIRYTVEYINASNNEYTNEELYLMMRNINKNIDNNSKSIQNLQNQDINSKINEINDKVDNLTNKVNSIEETTSNMSILKAYPVGSIYISENSTSPGELFGGTWETYGIGRTLVGVDTNQTEFATVGKTGGEKTHLLTIDEMPSHSHEFHLNIQHVDGESVPSSEALTSGLQLGGRKRYAGFTYKSGGSQPHNNLQPYVTVYMWKRIA